MPEEEPVFVRADSAQYSAKLVNIGSGGALISVLDCDLESAIGNVCGLYFADNDRMFGVKGEVLRKTGRYAAFRFVDVSSEQAQDIASKIHRMDGLAFQPEITRIAQIQLIRKDSVPHQPPA